VFNIPPGSTVRLTRTRSPNARGETHTIAGPYKGTLGEYIRRECWRPGAHCGGTDVIPGGTKGLNPSQGGVRGFKHSE
jgi:hypothetical protein